MYPHSRAHIRIKQGLEKNREYPLIANTRCCSIISNKFCSSSSSVHTLQVLSLVYSRLSESKYMLWSWSVLISKSAMPSEWTTAFGNGSCLYLSFRSGYVPDFIISTVLSPWYFGIFTSVKLGASKETALFRIVGPWAFFRSSLASSILIETIVYARNFEYPTSVKLGVSTVTVLVRPVGRWASAKASLIE